MLHVLTRGTMTLALKDGKDQSSEKVFVSHFAGTCSRARVHAGRVGAPAAVAFITILFLLALSSAIMSRAQVLATASLHVSSTSASNLITTLKTTGHSSSYRDPVNELQSPSQSRSQSQSPRISALRWFELPTTSNLNSRVLVKRDTATEQPSKPVTQLPQQCLKLSNDSVEVICDTFTADHLIHLSPQTDSDSSLSATDSYSDCQLSYCEGYLLRDVLPNWDSVRQNQTHCRKELWTLLDIEAIARHRVAQFDSLLSRYNCQSGYSVKWACQQCSRTYRDWVCSMLIPFYVDGKRVRPCRSICERVEQKCPYFHPASKEQYAGEPVFICIDPLIPFNHRLTPQVSYGQKHQCYDSCHLSSNANNNVSSECSKEEEAEAQSKKLQQQQEDKNQTQLHHNQTDQQPIELELMVLDGQGNSDAHLTAISSSISVPGDIQLISSSSSAVVQDGEVALDQQSKRTSVTSSSSFSSSSSTTVRTKVAGRPSKPNSLSLLNNSNLQGLASEVDTRNGGPSGLGGGASDISGGSDSREQDSPVAAALVQETRRSTSCPPGAHTMHLETKTLRVDTMGDSDDLDDELELNSVTTETTVTRLKGGS